ncbi:TonB-dependent receptor plug domain-containing protein [Acetobacter pomorum]|nr:TonB-dependent receptor [Acetobacter pomorum]
MMSLPSVTSANTTEEGKSRYRQEVHPVAAHHVGKKNIPDVKKASHKQAALPSSPENISVVGKQESSVLSGNTRRHSTVNVQVISAQEIVRTGQSNAMAALEQLIPSVSSPSFSGVGSNRFIRTMQLRNLSADQTLVLVNGKRRHLTANFNANAGPNSGTEPADLSLIPLSAIDHIEVITEGASALYGQDAIAGAVNIVLKHNTKGGSLNFVDSGYYAGDGVGVNGYGDYAIKLGHHGGYLDVAAQVSNQLPTNRSGLYTGSMYFPLADGSADPRQAKAGRDYNRLEGLGHTTMETLSVNGELPVTDSIRGYLTATYGHRTVENQVTYRNQANDNTVRALYPDGFIPLMGMTENDFQVNGGVKGTTAGFDWDGYVTFGRDDESYTTLNSNNPTFGLASKRNFYDGSDISSQFVTGFKASRNFHPSFLSRPVTLEFGGEYRHDTFQLTAGEYQSWADGGEAVLDGPNAGALATPGASGHIGASPETASDTARDTFDGHANLSFHILPKWEWTLGGHVVNYSNLATTETGSIGTRYDFNKRWAVRANINTGYRPPTLGQENYYYTSTFPTYTFAQLPTTSAAAKALGGGQLKGEYSRSYSIGIDAHPADDFTLTANLYRIAINDRMANSTQFGGTAVENMLSNLGLNGIRYVQYYTNPVNTVTNGGDVSAAYHLNLHDYGQWIFAVGVNFSDTEISHYNSTPSQLLALNQPYFNGYAQNTLLHSSPKNRETLDITWSKNKWLVSFQEQRYGQLTYIANPSLATQDWTVVHPAFITNLTVNYDINTRWSLSVGAQNLFNKYPNQVSQAGQASSSGAFKYPYYSAYGFMGGYYFAKVSYHL